MVAYADILACHLIGVVQRRAGDCRAGQLHGLELRDRRQDARAAHLHRYALNDGLRPLRRILVRARPARTVRRRAKRVVEPPLVQLHHGAVDLEPERVAQRLQLIDRGEHLLHRGAGLRPGRHGEAPAAKRRDHLRMRREAVAANAAGVVDDDVQRTARRLLRVKLLKRTRRRVARVGERFAPGLLLALVQLHEAVARHVHLAAHLQLLRRVVRQAERHGADGLHVVRDIVAHLPVAARRSLHEPASLVAERHRHAIHLRLHAVGEAVNFLPYHRVEVCQLPL